jgi:hypothetical protein
LQNNVTTVRGKTFNWRTHATEDQEGKDRGLAGDSVDFRLAREFCTGRFSGEAVGLRASAVGVSLTVSDTGALPSSGGSLNTSVASVNVLGLVSAEVLGSSTSGSGSSSQSQSAVASLNLLGGLVTADLVKSNSSSSCSSAQTSVSGNSQLVGLVVAGQPILTSNPNVAISAPGGISVIVNEQTSSSGGNSGSITVNALHVTGPSIDIVVSSAHSDITCP